MEDKMVTIDDNDYIDYIRRIILDEVESVLVPISDGLVYHSVLFSKNPKLLGRHNCGPIDNSWVFVSVMRFGSFYFDTDDYYHPEYIAEKTGCFRELAPIICKIISKEKVNNE